jgi:ribosomal protein S27E
MTVSKAARLAHRPGPRPDFRIVCINCDALGIVFDCPEGAPPSTQIKCRHCGAPRGTLGDLRKLSCSDRRDLFEV